MNSHMKKGLEGSQTQELLCLKFGVHHPVGTAMCCGSSLNLVLVLFYGGFIM